MALDSIQHDRLTVAQGADPEARPAPRGSACLARAPYLRLLLIGFWGATRALRDGDGVGWRRGSSTTSYLPANGVWGGQEPRREGNPAPGTPEPVWGPRKRRPEKARPREEEVSRGQPELRSCERAHAAEHALWEEVGFSTHADSSGEVGGPRGSASVRVRVGGGRRGCARKTERAVLELSGSSPAASSVVWSGCGGVGRPGGISMSWAEGVLRTQG